MTSGENGLHGLFGLRVRSQHPDDVLVDFADSFNESNSTLIQPLSKSSDCNGYLCDWTLVNNNFGQGNFFKKQGLRLSICSYWKNYIFCEKIS